MPNYLGTTRDERAMATLANLARTISGELALPANRVGHVAKTLQAAGLLPKGKGGRGGVNAPISRERDAVRLLIGCCGVSEYKYADQVVLSFEALPTSKIICRKVDFKIIEGVATSTYTDYYQNYKWHTFSFGEELAIIIRAMRRWQQAYCEIASIELSRSDAELTAKITAVPDRPAGAERVEMTAYFAAPDKEPFSLANYDLDLPVGSPGRNATFVEDLERSMDDVDERARTKENSIAHTIRIPGRVLNALAKLFGPLPADEEDLRRPLSAFEHRLWVDLPPKA